MTSVDPAAERPLRPWLEEYHGGFGGTRRLVSSSLVEGERWQAAKVAWSPEPQTRITT